MDTRPRQALSGKVTLDEKPMATGRIQFMPATAEVGTAAYAEITGGQYVVPASEGLVPGRYTVHIVGNQPPAPNRGINEPPGAKPKPKFLPEPIPARYNSKTSLSAEVKAAAQNTFDFAITSK